MSEIKKITKEQICLIIDRECKCGKKYHPNWPLYDNDCKRGASCNRPNCFHKHPPERKSPERKYRLCGSGDRLCFNPLCHFIHTTHKKMVPYNKFKSSKPCIFGPRCPDKKCGRVHTSYIARCRFSVACNDKKCLLLHNPVPTLCPSVKKGFLCPRLISNNCWYMYHEVETIQRKQEKKQERCKPCYIRPCKFGNKCTRKNCWFRHSVNVL